MIIQSVTRIQFWQPMRDTYLFNRKVDKGVNDKDALLQKRMKKSWEVGQWAVY